MSYRYVAIPVKETTKNRVDQCTERHESYDETVNRIVDIYQSFQLVRESVIDHALEIIKQLAPYSKTKDERVATFMLNIINHLEAIEELMIHPPKPSSPKYIVKPHLKDFAETILKRQTEGDEENE